MIDIAALDHFLLFFVAALSFYLTFFRTLHAVGICGAILFALGIVVTDAHFLLAGLMLEPSTNPQYITVGFCVVAAASISARALFRQRSIDRILVAAAMVSVLITAYVFHYVLVATILPSWARDGGWTSSFLLELDEAKFREECAAIRLSCFIGPELDEGALRADLRDRIVSIKEHFERETPTDPSAHAFGHFNDLGDNGVATVLFYSAPGDVRVIVDEVTGKRIHKVIRDGFYLLSTIAHTVWIVGALSLIAFHRRRFRKKAAR